MTLKVRGEVEDIDLDVSNAVEGMEEYLTYGSFRMLSIVSADIFSTTLFKFPFSEFFAASLNKLLAMSFVGWLED